MTSKIEFRYYTTDWCGLCHQMELIFSEVSTETRAHLRARGLVAEADELVETVIDVEEMPILADSHEVTDIPVIQVIIDGDEELRLVGSRPKRDVQRAVAELFASKWHN